MKDKKRKRCAICRKLYIKRNRSFCCSDACRTKYRKNWEYGYRRQYNIGFKICRTCKELYIEEYEQYCKPFKGYRYCSDTCRNKAVKERKALYAKKNKDILAEYGKKYYQEHREEIIKRNRKRVEAKRKAQKLEKKKQAQLEREAYVKAIKVENRGKCVKTSFPIEVTCPKVNIDFDFNF